MRTLAKSTYLDLRKYTLAFVVSVAYFVAAGLSLNFTQGVGATATIWPASGVFLSALLFATPRQILPISCGVGLASICVNLLFGVSVPVALAFSVANVAEGLLISQLIIRTSRVSRMFEEMRALMIFAGAAIVGAIVSAAIAATLSSNLSLAFFVSWFTTVCLGVLIITPLIVTMVKNLHRAPSRLQARDLAGVLLLSVIVSIVSALALSLDNERFLFLPVMGVIAATYLYGSRVAAIIICLIAVIATTQTQLTGTPTGLLGLNSETLFLQFYLLSLVCAAWPLSVLMTRNERVISQHIETNAYLKMAESTAMVGHWHLKANNTSLMWSDEVYRIHGVDPETFSFNQAMDLEEATSLDLYHADDRERVRETLLTAMDRQEGFTYDARIIQPNGSERYVTSIGRPRYDQSGNFEGLFGTFQDITDKMKTLETLQIARTEALRKANTAQRLAETDDLTGMDNRRKILASLDAAAGLAKNRKEPLMIALVDIDHFKLVNDRYGHHVGDIVLRRVASIMSSHLHPNDQLGRLGGEEFLVLLPFSHDRDSHAAIEQMRQRIAGENWAAVGTSSVTVSAGIASVGLDEDVESALRRADRALYRAKADGRNLLRLAA